MRTPRLTIYLLSEVEQFDDAIDDDGRTELEVSELRVSSGLTGRFYFKKDFPNTPSWARYLEPAVEGGIAGVQSASASGLLIVRVDEHTFALTFGYGRSFLDQSKIERRFGQVALNLIDEKQIRSSTPSCSTRWLYRRTLRRAGLLSRQGSGSTP